MSEQLALNTRWDSIVPKCQICKVDAPRGSKFCPRCGNVLDDGLNQTSRYILSIILATFGLALVVVAYLLIFHR